MEQSTEVKDLAAALAEVAKKIKHPVKDKTAKVKMKAGGSYEFNYCGLSSVIDVSRELLVNSGLVVTQGAGVMGTITGLFTQITHTSGQWQRTFYPMDFRGDAQAKGSEVTYARRYALSAMLNICSEDDDDGNRGDGNDARIADRDRGRGNDDRGRGSERARDRQRPDDRGRRDERGRGDDRGRDQGQRPRPERNSPLMEVNHFWQTFADIMKARDCNASWDESMTVLDGLLKSQNPPLVDGSGAADISQAPAGWRQGCIDRAKNGNFDRHIAKIRERKQQSRNATSAPPGADQPPQQQG